MTTNLTKGRDDLFRKHAELLGDLMTGYARKGTPWWDDRSRQLDRLNAQITAINITLGY